MSIHDRTSKVTSVVESLERDMELLCVTGVEDKLQDNVRPTLELLKNAGIKVNNFHLFLHIQIRLFFKCIYKYRPFGGLILFKWSCLFNVY